MFLLYMISPTFQEYSQFLPCGHPVITDTRYYGQNPALHLAKATYMYMYRGLTENDSRYCGL